MQAICDGAKRFSWISPEHHGASHDSAAWSSTKLNNIMQMQRMKPILENHGLFLVGNTSYPLSSYLMMALAAVEAGLNVAWGLSVGSSSSKSGYTVLRLAHEGVGVLLEAGVLVDPCGGIM